VPTAPAQRSEPARAGLETWCLLPRWPVKARARAEKAARLAARARDRLERPAGLCWTWSPGSPHLDHTNWSTLRDTTRRDPIKVSSALLREIDATMLDHQWFSTIRHGSTNVMNFFGLEKGIFYIQGILFAWSTK
jgi:hypothetical protein